MTRMASSSCNVGRSDSCKGFLTNPGQFAVHTIMLERWACAIMLSQCREQLQLGGRQLIFEWLPKLAQPSGQDVVELDAWS